MTISFSRKYLLVNSRFLKSLHFNRPAMLNWQRKRRHPSTKLQQWKFAGASNDAWNCDIIFESAILSKNVQWFVETDSLQSIHIRVQIYLQRREDKPVYRKLFPSMLHDSITFHNDSRSCRNKKLKVSCHSRVSADTTSASRFLREGNKHPMLIFCSSLYYGKI